MKKSGPFLFIGGLIILVLIFWRQGRETITQVMSGAPLSFDFGDGYTPSTSLGFPELRIPIINGVSGPPPSLTPVSADNGCCCNGGGSQQVVRVSRPGLVIPSPGYTPGYRPAPCVNQIDYQAMAAPGTPQYIWHTTVGRLQAKHFNELAQAGYQQSIAGWLNYIVDYPRGIAGNQNRSASRALILEQGKNYMVCR